ncbi:MAG: iron-containing alcohol dehydrogenase [Phycisphaerales bacterium]|nr:iron-containing alcohol dehydrogenase [Phycisphaerales bacterium]
MGQDGAGDLLARSTTHVVCEAGCLRRLGEFVADAGVGRVLLVTDPGIVAAGHVTRALDSIAARDIEATVFQGVRENPTTLEAQACAEAARRAGAELLVALGGGSAMDCMKGANLLLTNGGRIQDYRGDAPPEVLTRRNGLLPMIAVPTTAGTGSEAQSFALISDPVTHEKLVCGDRRAPGAGGLRPILALLDPELTRTVPRAVAAAVGIDAIAHAVETAGCNVRSAGSLEFSTAAWRLLSRSFVRSLSDPEDGSARRDMLVGAHLAGAAIERSMLGVAHSCANPLTAQYGVVHGRAVGLMLPHVVRFNAEPPPSPYAALAPDAAGFAEQIESFLEAAALPRRLRDLHVPAEALPELARQAAMQWTARFNPRPVTVDDLLTLYQRAW